MDFNEWLDVFLNEKGLNLDEEFDIKGRCWINVFTYRDVVEQMKRNAAAETQAEFREQLVKYEKKKDGVKRYIRLLARDLAI